MQVRRIQLPPSGSPDAELSRLLAEGWRRGIGRGAIAYDPAAIESVSVPPFTFLLLPGRDARPRVNGVAAKGLHRGHSECPFDEPEFLDEREVLRASRRGSSYHIALNRFPVFPLHYLAIRPADAPPATLPQSLLGPEEIEDMIVLARCMGHPFRFFFNSNAGGDGSRSGSSVNHWHFQIFPTRIGIAEWAPRIDGEERGVEIGAIPGWPAHHRVYRSSEEGPLARALWADLERIDRRDGAYNVEISTRTEGPALALLFPRAPTEDLVLPGGGRLTGDFGGIELSGSVVVPGRPLLEWIRAHPDEAAARIRKRIREGTRPV